MSSDEFLSLNEIAFNVLNIVYERFTKNKEELSDEDLINIHSIFGNPFERATEILLKPNAVTVYYLEKQARSMIEIKGSRNTAYKILPDVNFCSCPAFQFQVLSSNSELTCKHVLAAWLAKVTNKCKEQIVSQQQYISLVCEMFMIDSE